MSENIALTVELKDNYEDALEKVIEALKSEGFGILTEIDVKETLKKKIGADFRKYIILGACNPPLAHKALQSEPLIGLMLPCNVTVEESESGSIVNLVNPNALLLSNPILSENDAVCTVAADAAARLTRVKEKLSAG
ncbi:MAG: DUF302 domain-containing protein [Anaerolineales bacterium]